ncbi:MAG: hypothetical protein K0R29_771 [Pseudobdellovibrio sp.]|nr:hypothetical protein [Pseudobdellovibrio sp.]
MKSLSLILVSILFAVNAKAQLSGDQPVPQEPVAQEPAPLEPTLPVPPSSEEPPVLQPPSEEPPVLEPPKPEPLPIIIGEAGYGGTGCTAGNALIGHDDQGRITVLLAPMIVSGGSSNAAFARAACSVRVPITVPEHHKLVIVEVSNKGLYGVEHGDSLVLTQESGFVGQDKVPQTLDLKPDGDGELNWDSSVGQLAESSCTKTENVLSLNTSALLRKQKAQQTSSLVALDSIEVQLMLELCED